MKEKLVSGRPIKLTDEVHTQIINAIRAGNYMETAAQVAGINKDTLYAWLRRGARAKQGNAENEDDYLFVSFSDSVEKALAESESIALAQIVKAANDGQWQAAAWRLERRFPDKWGRKDRHDIRHSGMVAHSEMSAEDAEDYHRSVAKFFGTPEMIADDDQDVDD